MYRYIGWLNIFFLFVMVSPFLLRQFNKRVHKIGGAWYPKLTKVLRTIHKPLGITIAVLALIHGLLALETFRIHTGTLIWFTILLMAILGATFYFTKKKPFLLWHRRALILLVLLLLLHLLYPNALFYLFR